MLRFLMAVSIALAAACLATVPLHAQPTPISRDQLRVVDSTRIQIVDLRDGSSLVGRIVAVRADTVDFQTSVGIVAIATKDIRQIKEAPSASVHEGRYWFPNPNATRLFFAPTGRMLEKGDGYFADYELFFPGIAYGVTDNITIGGGVSILPTGLDEQIYYLTPKVGGSFGDQIQLAAGLLFVGTPEGTGGVGFGVGTFGTPDKSLTVGLGYGFAGGDVESKPVVMLGGEVRVSRRVAIVTENYLLPIDDDNVVYSFGLRFMGEKLTTDLAIFNVAGSGVIGLPFVDFVFSF